MSVTDDGWGKRKRGGETELDITPMIDVTFLLLIFFMVTSTMKPSSDLDLPSARHGTGVDTNSSTFISIKAPESKGDKPTILIGQGTPREATIEEIRAFVEEGLPEKSMVVIKADREVPHGFITEVAKTVADLEGIQFFMAVQDKRSGR